MSNAELLDKADSKRLFEEEVMMRKMRYFGHLVRGNRNISAARITKEDVAQESKMLFISD